MKTLMLYIFSYMIFAFASCSDFKNDTQDINDTIDCNVLTSKFGQFSYDLWGIGIIIDKTHNRGEMLNFPDSSLNIYDKPNGDIIGKVYRETKNGYGLLIENSQTKIVEKINSKDYTEVTYEGQNLKYYKVDNEFINCFIHSIDSGVWIKKTELEILNFSSICWKEFLIKSGKKMHPPHKTSIQLLDSTGLFIDSLKYGDFEIKIIDKTIGNFIKVEIYNPDECLGRRWKESWRGMDRVN